LFFVGQKTQLNGPLFTDGGRTHKQAILLPPNEWNGEEAKS